MIKRVTVKKKAVPGHADLHMLLPTLGVAGLGDFFSNMTQGGSGESSDPKEISLGIIKSGNASADKRFLVHEVAMQDPRKPKTPDELKKHSYYEVYSHQAAGKDVIQLDDREQRIAFSFLGGEKGYQAQKAQDESVSSNPLMAAWVGLANKSVQLANPSYDMELMVRERPQFRGYYYRNRSVSNAFANAFSSSSKWKSDSKKMLAELPSYNEFNAIYKKLFKRKYPDTCYRLDMAEIGFNIYPTALGSNGPSVKGTLDMEELKSLKNIFIFPVLKYDSVTYGGKQKSMVISEADKKTRKQIYDAIGAFRLNFIKGSGMVLSDAAAKKYLHDVREFTSGGKKSERIRIGISANGVTGLDKLGSSLSMEKQLKHPFELLRDKIRQGDHPELNNAAIVFASYYVNEDSYRGKEVSKTEMVSISVFHAKKMPDKFLGILGDSSASASIDVHGSNYAGKKGHQTIAESIRDIAECEIYTNDIKLLANDKFKIDDLDHLYSVLDY